MGTVHQIPHRILWLQEKQVVMLLHVGDYQIMFPVTGFPIRNYVAISYNYLALPLYGQVRI